MTFTVSPTFSRSPRASERGQALGLAYPTHELSFVVPDQHVKVHVRISPFDPSHHAREGDGSAGLEVAKSDAPRARVGQPPHLSRQLPRML